MNEAPRRTLGKYVLAALAAALLAHFASMAAAPRWRIGADIEQAGQGSFNHWVRKARAVETRERAGGPEADLAVSACAFDLSHGPVEISAAPWAAYQSLSLYGADGAAFFTISDREAPRRISLMLIKAGERPPEDAQNIIESPTSRGIALLRRLAPSASLYAAAGAAAAEDMCATAPRS